MGLKQNWKYLSANSPKSVESEFQDSMKCIGNLVMNVTEGRVNTAYSIYNTVYVLCN